MNGNLNSNAQASTSNSNSSFPTDNPLACSVCHLPFRASDKLRILTSTACGHSYHADCARAHYDSNDLAGPSSAHVHSFKGYCLRPDCPLQKKEQAKTELDGHATFAKPNARQAASRAMPEPPSTVIIRNIALERVIAHLAARSNVAQTEGPRAASRELRSATNGTRDMVGPASAIPRVLKSSNGTPSVNGKQRALDPPAASQSTRDPSAISVPGRPAKRVKLAKGSRAPLAALYEAEEAHDDIAADAEAGTEGAGYMPSSSPPPSSPLPDSDPEDESRTLAQLHQASQAIALAPVEGAEGSLGDGGSENGDEEEEDVVMVDEEEEEVPLDKYGMPPLSQWRRSMAV